jgi:peptidoglycan/LPS O-acetylase OafA/YrhL
LNPNAGGRIVELDGVRGLAIAMVLAHHYFFLPINSPPGTLPSYIQAAGRLTWSGVDLFFVLSGFLIGGILLDARLSANYFSVFYTRRFFRIVPIYAACLLFVCLLSVLASYSLVPRLAWMFQERVTLISYPLFLQNFWMAKHSTYGIFGLGVTWSLAIEEQFYLTLPLLIRFLRSNAVLLAAILVGIALAPISRLLLHAFYPAHYMSWVVLMPCRADALLLGVLGAIAIRNRRALAWLRLHRGLLLFALVGLAIGLVLITKFYPDPYGFFMLSGGFTYLALFYLTLILCAVLFPGSVLGALLRWRWLTWLGSIAYGTYLYHELIRSLFFGFIWSHLPLGMSAKEFCVSLLALLVTLAFSRASWLYFEKPLVVIGHRNGYLRRDNLLDGLGGNEGTDVANVAI